MIRSASLTVNTAGHHTGTEHSLCDWQIPVRRQGTRYRGDLHHSYSDQDSDSGDEMIQQGPDKRGVTEQGSERESGIKCGQNWCVELREYFDSLLCDLRIYLDWTRGDLERLTKTVFGEFYLPLTVNLDARKSLHSSSGWKHKSIHILL